jgi:N-acetylglutamate synthase-like GNAT family acetyltransferase
MSLTVEPLHRPSAEFEMALSAAGLPTGDLHEHGRRFYRFEDDDGLIGFGGLEALGAQALARSIVIVDDRRGAGLGSAILAWLEAEAADHGASDLYLLTTSAADFFARHGYAALPRADAPAAIAASRQFSSLCPGSAAFMFEALRT